MTTITLYKTKITPDKIMRLDNIQSYLSEPTLFKKVLENCQYQKAELNKHIIIQMDQEASFGADGFNYVSIRNDGEVNTYYFFIMDANWKSQNSVELILYMDTLNSFWNNVSWSANTKISREHKNRFIQASVIQSGNYQLRRLIDRNEEGISAPKIYIENSKVNIYNQDLPEEYRNSLWYLIYKTSDDLSTTNISNPISCYCTSDKPIPIKGTLNGIKYTDYSPGTMIAITNIDNRGRSITYTSPTGVSQTLGDNTSCRGFNLYFTNSGIRVTAVGTSLSQIDTRSIFTNINMNARIFTSGSYSGTSIDFNTWITDVITSTLDTLHFNQQTVLATIDTIDRTDSRYMQIIELPYPPFDLEFNTNKMLTPEGWTVENNMFKLEQISTKAFKTSIRTGVQLNNMNVTLDTRISRKQLPHDIKYESKLYNSAFYNFIYKYDSFEKQIDYERVHFPVGTSPLLPINFMVTSTINSNFVFDIGSSYYTELTDNSKFMYIKRSNSLPILSNSYVDFIRNGYNYQKKNISINSTLQVMSGTKSAIQTDIMARLAKDGITTAGRVGVGATLISSAFSTIASSIQANRDLNQKLNELKASPSSMNGSDDLDLMKATVGNKLYTCEYTIPDDIKNATYNLFRLTGYACTEYHVPDFNSRLYYNFIQCDPVFREEQTLKLTEDVIVDFKEKFRQGVTVYHRVDGTYDFEQQYENFESWLV